MGAATSETQTIFYKQSLFCQTSNCTQSWLDNEREVIDIFHRPYWRTLHFLGDQLGQTFSDICDKNPQLLDLFGNEDKFRFSFGHCLRSTTDFSFTAEKVMVDLTKITDSGNVIRFQSVYHAKIFEKPIVFNSGASISVTPDKDNFITFDSNTSSTKLTGITTSAECEGQGIVQFKVLDDNSITQTIETEVFLCRKLERNYLVCKSIATHPKMDLVL
jgi:hypothetical protein